MNLFFNNFKKVGEYHISVVKLRCDTLLLQNWDLYMLTLLNEAQEKRNSVHSMRNMIE